MTDIQLTDQLRALRVAPPDNGFSLRLNRALAEEASQSAMVAEPRSLRTNVKGAWLPSWSIRSWGSRQWTRSLLAALAVGASATAGWLVLSQDPGGPSLSAERTTGSSDRRLGTAPSSNEPPSKQPRVPALVPPSKQRSQTPDAQQADVPAAPSDRQTDPAELSVSQQAASDRPAPSAGQRGVSQAEDSRRAASNKARAQATGEWSGAARPASTTPLTDDGAIPIRRPERGSANATEDAQNPRRSRLGVERLALPERERAGSHSAPGTRRGVDQSEKRRQLQEQRERRAREIETRRRDIPQRPDPVESDRKLDSPLDFERVQRPDNNERPFDRRSQPVQRR